MSALISRQLRIKCSVLLIILIINVIILACGLIFEFPEEGKKCIIACYPVLKGN